VTMSIRHLLLTAAATALCSSAAAAQGAKAQGDRPLVGPNVEYASNSLDIGIGAQFAYPIVNRFDIYPSFNYYFPGNSVHVWSLSGDVRYWPDIKMKNAGLYAGAGLNYTHSSVSTTILGNKVSASSSDVGLNLFGGWDFKQVSWRPFAQLRIVVGNADRVEIGGGVNFKL
jgi:hypothetical protein